MKSSLVNHLFVFSLFAISTVSAAVEVYRDPKASAEARTEDLIQRMTLEEKLDYLGGFEAFCIRQIQRLGIPRIRMSDGPVGVHPDGGQSTAYPASICVAASWNRELARQTGIALGRDSRARGVHILLAPGVNMYRNPRSGRNFEYAGEDPFLAGATATNLIQGLQSQGVLGTIKHLVGNEQETQRLAGSSEIDERTLREIYLPAFKAAIQEGKVGCVMNAYNKVNGVHCTENAFLNIQILRKEWGFTGIVMSDWNATHDAVGAANGGLDLEMPEGKFMNRQKLLPAIQDGRVAQATIDDKVRHILRTIIAAGFLDRPQQLKDIPKDDPTSAQVALEAAHQGIVLLQNKNNLLPLDLAKVKSVAVIGPNSHPAIFGGSGSSFTEPYHAVSVLDGIRQVNPSLTVTSSGAPVEMDALLKSSTFEGPISLELFDNMELKGEPVTVRTVDQILLEPKGKPVADGLSASNYSARWTSRIKPTVSGTHLFACHTFFGIRVILDGKTILDDWKVYDLAPNVKVELEAGKTYELQVESRHNHPHAVAKFGWGIAPIDPITAAKQADVAVVCVGFNKRDYEGEAQDRSFALPKAQVELIKNVAAANPRTIVILNAGGGVDWQGWLDKVPAVLHAWYPGQEGGRAVADILFGAVNPSGKLPVTFEKRVEDNPSFPFYLRAEDLKEKKAVYGEGIFVGYRGYDQNNIEPQFCFGHGLSYTTFEYSDLKITPSTISEGQAVKVSFAVRNTGRRAGAEVAQLYINDEKSSVPRPPQELKGFERIELQPGEQKRVTITLGSEAMAFFDPVAKQWTVEPGMFNVRVGASSRDLRLKGSFTCTGGK